MSYRLLLKLAATLIAAALLVAAVRAWRTDQRDRAQLAAELAATRQLLIAADARQHNRDAQLAQTLAALAAEKRTIITPAQIIRELPKELPLPAPITLQTDTASSVGATLGSPAANASTAATGEASLAPTKNSAASVATTSQSSQKPPGGAVIPAEDLKPLYDFTLDCKACQAKLADAQGNLADEQKKTAALTQERDQALRISRGGSTLRRIGRAAKWFAIGAAAGAVLSRAH